MPWRCAAGARRLPAGRRVAAVARCDTASGGPRPAADFLRRVVRRLPPPRRRYGLQHRRRSRRPSSAKIAARAAANQQPDAAFHLSGGPQAAGEGPIERATARAPGVAAMRATRSAPRVAKGVVQIVALERATHWSQAMACAGATTRSTRRRTRRVPALSQSAQPSRSPAAFQVARVATRTRGSWESSVRGNCARARGLCRRWPAPVCCRSRCSPRRAAPRYRMASPPVTRSDRVHQPQQAQRLRTLCHPCSGQTVGQEPARGPRRTRCVDYGDAPQRSPLRARTWIRRPTCLRSHRHGFPGWMRFEHVLNAATDVAKRPCAVDLDGLTRAVLDGEPRRRMGFALR